MGAPLPDARRRRRSPSGAERDGLRGDDSTEHGLSPVPRPRTLGSPSVSQLQLHKHKRMQYAPFHQAARRQLQPAATQRPSSAARTSQRTGVRGSGYCWKGVHVAIHSRFMQEQRGAGGHTLTEVRKNHINNNQNENRPRHPRSSYYRRPCTSIDRVKGQSPRALPTVQYLTSLNKPVYFVVTSQLQ